MPQNLNNTINLNNIIFSDKELITPPLNGLILPGITRQSILQLSEEWQEYKVTERVMTMHEVVNLSKESRVCIAINMIKLLRFYVWLTFYYILCTCNILFIQVKLFSSNDSYILNQF